MPRRDGQRVLIATTGELADYGCRLGHVADDLAKEDPLVPPSRVLERLRGVRAPDGMSALGDARLIRLAVAASHVAAVSSRQEIYPINMAADRALRLSQWAFNGVARLTGEAIRQRVSGRYPAAQRLPDRPALDELLKSCGFEFEWDPTAENGQGAYVSRMLDQVSIMSDPSRSRRVPTSSGPLPAGQITEKQATARQFEERLERALAEGMFVAMTVDPALYFDARDEFRRFPVELVDLEELFIDALRETAEQAKVKWERVLQADAVTGGDDWHRLMLLVQRSMPKVERRIASANQTVLLINANLLGRYGQLDMVDRLRDQAGRAGCLPGLWMLIPADEQRPMPLMDGRALPIIGPAQRARVPESWVRNEHRGSGRKLVKSG